jgi:diguanylate cyclase (GGDEF)-like protein/PAS domain S-box-containing protein
MLSINPTASLEAFEASPIAMLITNKKGCILYSNNSATQLFGYTKEELANVNTTLIHPQDLPKQTLLFEYFQQRPEKTKIISVRYIDKIGRIIVANLHITANYDGSGKVVSFIQQIMNLSANRQLHADEVLQEMLFYSSDGIYVVDAEFGHILSCNQEGHQKLQYSKQEILKLRVSDISPHFNNNLSARIPDSGPDFVKELTWAEYTAAIKQAKTMCIESNHQRKDGTVFPIEINVTYIEKNGREYIVAIARDITERRQHIESKLEKMSTDPLTKLVNRRLLFRKLNSLSTHHCDANVAFLYVDIDHFKSFNDLHGHACGDAVLQHVAYGLTKFTRENDIVARLGGDEFLVVLVGIKSLAHLQSIANSFIKTISTSLQLKDGSSFCCEVSIGGTIQTLQNNDFSSSIETADKAMYEAKKIKGSSYSFLNNETSVELPR